MKESTLLEMQNKIKAINKYNTEFVKRELTVKRFICRNIRNFQSLCQVMTKAIEQLKEECN